MYIGDKNFIVMVVFDPPRYYRLEEPITEILYGTKNGVHTFGYNSAESEPVWMKSGSLCAHCWVLSRPDLGAIRAVATV